SRLLSLRTACVQATATRSSPSPVALAFYQHTVYKRVSDRSTLDEDKGMNELKLSLVIPAHNEEKNLPKVLTGLLTKVRAEQIPYELVIVNDNSRDGTAGVVQRFMAEDPSIRMVERRPPNGFGRAIRDGLEEITGDVVIIYMADASDHPEDAVAYYRKIEEGYDCVFG